MAPPRNVRRIPTGLSTIFPDEAARLDGALKDRAARPVAPYSPRPAPATSSEALLSSLRGLADAQQLATAKAEELVRLAWMLLLSQSPLPITRVMGSFKGDAIGAVDGYLSLVQNKQAWPIAVRIAAELNGARNPGVQVKLAFGQDGSDEQVADYLGSSGQAPSYNKRISDPIILRPAAALYINTADVNFPLDAGDVFRIRIYDPGDFIPAAAAAFTTR